MIVRPLLAATLDDITSINFPILATPKIDGIRVLKINGKALTRKFKEIPNIHIKTLLEKHLPDGLDGEIITPGNFNDIQSQVMTIAGEPKFTFYAFDYVKNDLAIPYKNRVNDLFDLCTQLGVECPFKLVVLYPKWIHSTQELLDYEIECLEKGFEGVMIRDPLGKYKCGRSTLKEQILLKLKRFQDSEAIVIGFEEKLHNDNLEEKDSFGLVKRSSKKAGMVPCNTLGALVVQDVKTKVVFKIGSGFDDRLKSDIWNNRQDHLNKLVKYKYQSVGLKNAPRFPVFLGFRSCLDV